MARYKKKMKEAGQGIGKYACTIKGGCGSSDAMEVYIHDDGSHSAHCFSCETGVPEINVDTLEVVEYRERRVVNYKNYEMEDINFGACSLKDRKIKESILEMYGVQIELEDDGETVEAHYYPTYRDGIHVGYRVRSRFKEGDPELEKHPEKLGTLKNFKGTIDDAKKGIELFGQWVVTPDKYHRVVVMEGELDCMTGAQLCSSHSKWPEHYAGCVSVPNGANVSGIKPQLEYLNVFKEIILAFDNDEAGKELTEKVAKLLPVGKVRLLKLPKKVKDLNQWWKDARNNGKRTEVLNGWWNCIFNAEKYSPAGIKSLSEGWGSYLNRGKEILIPFPDSFGELNEKTCGGYALGEIVTVAAPSSVGKSSFIKEMIYKALESTQYNIGICSFEETLDEFIEGMLSVHMSTQLNEISYDERDRGAEWNAFQDLLKMKGDCQAFKQAVKDIKEEDEELGDRIHYLDHQGACDGEELLSKIDFLTKGLDCKVIILDPVTLALSNSDMEEDEFASEIVKRTKRDKLAWINVHHVRKNSGGTKANSEGGDIAEEDMKGSGVWFQTSMINILLTRNKVHENDVIRNTTTIKMSKCRRHGKNTGIAGWVFYNGDTGRLELGMNPSDILEDQEVQDSMDDEIPW